MVLTVRSYNFCIDELYVRSVNILPRGNHEIPTALQNAASPDGRAAREQKSLRLKG